MILRMILLLALSMLSACATIIEGTSDTITLSTVPAGASCTIDRDGKRVGAVTPTPGSVRIDKSRLDLSIICSKDGFQTASQKSSASFTGTTFGNILLGGIVGIVVDAASGANSRYPSDITLVMAAQSNANDPPPQPPRTEKANTEAVARNPGKFSCPARNTNFGMSNGVDVVALGGSGLDCEYINKRTSEHFTTRGAFAALEPANSRAAPQLLAAIVGLWPLSPSKAIEASSGDARHSTNAYRVVGQEQVTVVAGTFSAWHIKHILKQGDGALEVLYDYWWSPEAGYVVKRNFTIVRGSWTGLQNSELVELRHM